jgi:RNAse (barnase) inhibitor barstar
LPPRFWLDQADAGTGADAARSWTDDGLTVRVIRGHKGRSERALFDEVAAALQFPPYFGENWDALDECVTDLEWLPARVGYVLYVLRADEVLVDEPERSLGILTRVLERAVEEWAKEIAPGEWRDRPAMPFNVVLQVSSKSPGSWIDRWSAAGATIERFD